MNSNQSVPQVNPITNTLVSSTKNDYFSSKEDVNIMKEILLKEVKPEDGDCMGLWILTMVDHWNNNIEKAILLMNNAIYVYRYDFVLKKVKDVKSIPIKDIVEIKKGTLAYPDKSLMPSRNIKGIEIVWGDISQVSWTQRWNPICKTIPNCILINHPLFYSKLDGDGISNIDRDKFSCENLTMALENMIYDQSKFKNENILVQSYGNVASLIFNQSALGFNKDRHGISF